MNKTAVLLILCLICSLLGFSQNQVDVQPAFEVLSEFDKVRDFTMSASGKEAYITIQSATEEVSVISRLYKVNEVWQVDVVPFSGVFKDLEPALSPDGLRLYFVSNRPTHDSISPTKDFDIWYVKRTNENANWSDPINLGGPVNSESNEFYPSLSENQNLYFTSDREGAMGKDDIFFSKWTDSGYSDPVPLDDHINSEGFEYNAYISKDESYLLFGGYRRADGQGSGDIYISHNDGNGNWSKAVPLPININSPFMDYCPFVDETNNTLYFTSRRDKKPENATSLEKLREYLNSYENGNSRIYKAPFSKN